MVIVELKLTISPVKKQIWRSVYVELALKKTYFLPKTICKLIGKKHIFLFVNSELQLEKKHTFLFVNSELQLRKYDTSPIMNVLEVLTCLLNDRESYFIVIGWEQANLSIILNLHWYLEILSNCTRRISLVV